MMRATNSIIKTYSELITFPTFEERVNYLMLHGSVGMDTFGYDRIFNQAFYSSTEWRRMRNYIIARDQGCDLAMPGREFPEKAKVFIHHLNPIDISDITDASQYLLNPEYLVACLYETHNAIHYGTMPKEELKVIERSQYDTCPWRR